MTVISGRMTMKTNLLRQIDTPSFVNTYRHESKLVKTTNKQKMLRHIDRLYSFLYKESEDETEVVFSHFFYSAMSPT